MLCKFLKVNVHHISLFTCLANLKVIYSDLPLVHSLSNKNHSVDGDRGSSGKPHTAV